MLVPVIRKADQKPLAEMIDGYNELIEAGASTQAAGRCHRRFHRHRHQLRHLRTTWATPIPLPEQTLVLGMGAGRKVPAWDEAKGQFVPVMEANFTLSFDHRVLDGGAAGRLLQRIASLINAPEQL